MKLRRFTACAALAVIVANSSSAVASTVTLDLTGAGGGSGGYGNSLNFSNNGVNVNVSSFGETGAETPSGSYYYLFENAEVYSWGSGLGSCNQFEGLASSRCNANQHEVDTVGRDDLVAFVFDQAVSFESLTVDPYNGPRSDPNDRDIIYWVGNSDSLPDLTLETFNTLAKLTGFGSEQQSSASSSYAPYTHGLYGMGNILLVSGNYHDLPCKKWNSTSDRECEAYKLSSISVATVPLPAAFWFFGSALLGLVGLRRRSSKLNA